MKTSVDAVSSFEDDPSATLLAIAVFLPADDTAVSSLVESSVIFSCCVPTACCRSDCCKKKTVLP